MSAQAGGDPPRFTKRGKRYFLDGLPVPSVTTILNEGFPSKALIAWAARTTAGYAVDQWDELAELPVSERLRVLEKAAWAKRDAAALRGTEIHALGEMLVHGQPVEIPEQHLGPVEAYAKFLDRFDVQPTLTECPVANPAHGWAGTPDLRAVLGGEFDYLLDLKTGKGVYESHALQLAAYAHAEIYLDGDGNVRTWTRPQRVAVVHVTSDSAELLPIDAGDRAYAVFRHASVVARYAREASEAYREHRPWPVGRAIEPASA
jgi:hypothetical protein